MLPPDFVGLSPFRHGTRPRSVQSMVKAVLRLAKLVPLLAFGALLCAPAGSATSLSPKLTFYVPLPIPISMPYQPWADTAAVAVSPDGNLVYVTDEKGNEVWEFSSDGVAPLEVDVGGAQASDRGCNRPARERLRGEQRQRHRREVHGRRQARQAVERPRREVDRDRRRPGLRPDDAVQRRRRVQLRRREAHGLRRELSGSMVGLPAATTRPRPRIAEEIGTDNSGNPIVVGESDQPLSSTEPDCHSVIEVHHQLSTTIRTPTRCEAARPSASRRPARPAITAS